MSQSEIKIDVEVPNEGVTTLTLEQAKHRHLLDDWEIEIIKNGDVVWDGDIALSLHEE